MKVKKYSKKYNYSYCLGAYPILDLIKTKKTKILLKKKIFEGTIKESLKKGWEIAILNCSRVIFFIKK
jgi:hypothetical protein